MKYTFGNDEAAAKRLEDIAEFFNPLSKDLILRHVKSPVDSGLDIGCGPGFSTGMLSEALECGNVCGLDNSPAFLEMARQRCPRCSFIEHDITSFPFPIKANAAYCRFLLTHLKDSVGLINRWVGELLPGGILFVEEVESVDTKIKVFNDYLNINASLVGSQGAELFVGRTLASGSYSAEVISSECGIIPVANSRAAGWFFPNTVTVWEKDEFLNENFGTLERKKISDELLRIVESGDDKQDITWKMRRIVLKKWAGV